jgi:hypothetical protein
MVGSFNECWIGQNVEEAVIACFQILSQHTHLIVWLEINVKYKLYL